MVSENLDLIHERVDDIPLLLGVMQQLKLPQLLDEHIGNHGHHQGWSNGELATVWISYILSEADHRKSVVSDWAERRRLTLEGCMGKPFRPVEFSDDRLGIVLKRLSDPEKWVALEDDLWKRSVLVYDLEATRIRLDSTTSYGYHSVGEDGLMQLGHSKDHRPDLPQLKLMAACADPHGHWLSSEVYPGNRADDRLYVPMISRVQEILKRKGLLYIGDSKMSALDTRAHLVAAGDSYLTPLAKVGRNGTDIEAWVSAIVDGEEAATLIWQENETEAESLSLIGGGYEFERMLNTRIGEEEVQWNERVLVIRSHQLAQQQDRGLQQRLNAAEVALLKLVSGKGKKVYDSEAALAKAADKILAQYKVEGLVNYDVQKQEELRRTYPGRGRPTRGAVAAEAVMIRYQVSGVKRNEAAIIKEKHRHGWRVWVTNHSAGQLPFADAYLTYRNGWLIERGFHLVKDKPIGIRPLHVRDEEQIRGLTYLLTIALRIMSLIEIQVRKGIDENKTPLTGLYPGQPKRISKRPTAKRLLQAIARTEINLTRIHIANQIQWNLTPLPQWIKDVLNYLKLSEVAYTRLIENST